MNRFALSAVALAALTACGKKAEAPATAEPVAAVAPAPKALTSGIDASHFDTASRPQDNLFRAVNGKWLDSFQIPADKSNYGSFTKLDDDAEAQLKTIIEEMSAKKDLAAGSEEQKIRDFYNAFMDEAKLEELGIKPIESTFAKIDALTSKAELSGLMAALAREGFETPIAPYVHQDNKNATQYIGDLYQNGLGLPDRDYYLLNDAKFKSIREAYAAHIEKMLTLAGMKDAGKAAKDILAFETRIAKAHWDKVENRDPVKGYNKLDAAALKKLTSEIDWAVYLKGVGFDALPAIIVSQPSYITGLGNQIKTTSLDTWKIYLKWHALSSAAPYLNKAIVDENFAFNGKTLNGIQELRPRWKRGVEATEGALGEALGKVYVGKHFPPENKVRMEALVANLRKGYEQSINSLAWMSDETKKKAQEKLAKFAVKIGYPNEWRDYSTLEVKAGDLAGNLERANAFEYQRNLNKLGKPIDRNEWGMTPQTVNAYYNPEMNEIVFPAAILQPPFFDVNADDAVNYGGIGAVIGHEFSHGFDDQGSQYDGDGNLSMWWTKEDRVKFDALGAKLAAQYDKYEPVKGYFVNGKFTLGENIGDLGGLTVAHKAYVLSLAGKEAPVIDGLTGDQRFFYGWSQVWARKYREENLLTRLKTDPHSPSEFRANGTPVNIPAFYSAFGLKEGDKMFKPEADRITIW
ncbi:MAG: M13-type metalloendopeptidase [Pseudomonadota bacterium]